MKPIVIASIRGHYEILRILQIALFRNVFQKRKQCFDLGFWSRVLTYLSHEMRTRACHDWKEAHEQFYPLTFVGRDAHRLLQSYTLQVLYL